MNPLLVISLVRRSRRGINSTRIRQAAVRVLTDPNIVGTIRNRNDLDFEKLVSVTMITGEANSVSVLQTAPINGLWIDKGNPEFGMFRTAIVGAVNSGLNAALAKRAFSFTTNKPAATEAANPQAGDRGRRSSRGQPSASAK